MHSSFPDLSFKTRIVTVCFVTFCIVEVVTFCLKYIFHIFSSNLLHFGLMLHFASYVVTFCVKMFPICVATAKSERRGTLLTTLYCTSYLSIVSFLESLSD